MNITFSEELHEYKDDKGNIIPSVTQIIKDSGVMDFSGVSADVLDDASERGEIVHLITELYDRLELDDSTVDPQLSGFLQAYIKFRFDFKIVQFKAIESMIFHSAGYAGTLDRMAVDVDDKIYLYDIKTGIKHPAHDLQVAAYAYSQSYCKPDEIGIMGTLYLSDDGTYRFVKTENKLFSFQVFTSILLLYKWKQANKLL